MWRVTRGRGSAVVACNGSRAAENIRSSNNMTNWHTVSRSWEFSDMERKSGLNASTSDPTPSERNMINATEPKSYVIANNFSTVFSQYREPILLSEPYVYGHGALKHRRTTSAVTSAAVCLREGSTNESDGL